MLKAWRPEKRPQFTAMAPCSEPDGEFWDLEACKVFSGDWHRWVTLPPGVRGRLMAHEIEVALRKGYSEERAHKEAEAESKAKGKGGGRPNAWQAMWAGLSSKGES